MWEDFQDHAAQIGNSSADQYQISRVLAFLQCTKINNFPLKHESKQESPRGSRQVDSPARAVRFDTSM